MDIDHSRPMLCHLLLRSLLLGYYLPSPPANPFPSSPDVVFRPASAQDNPLTRASPISIPAYRRTFAFFSLALHYQRPTPRLLLLPHHACKIHVASTPTLLTKYFLMWPSTVVPQPPVTNTDCTTSPLPHILSPFQRPLILAVGPPTLLSSPESC